MQSKYRYVVDFFFKDGKLFFYAYDKNEDKVILEEDQFETLFLKLSVICNDLNCVSFAKVSMMESVASILRKNQVDHIEYKKLNSFYYDPEKTKEVKY